MDAGADGEEEEDLYCICRQPWNENGPMMMYVGDANANAVSSQPNASRLPLAFRLSFLLPLSLSLSLPYAATASALPCLCKHCCRQKTAARWHCRSVARPALFSLWATGHCGLSPALALHFSKYSQPPFPNRATRGKKLAGVVLDKPDGLNDGVIKGKRYFQCDENHGVMVTPGMVTFLKPKVRPFFGVEGAP